MFLSVEEGRRDPLRVHGENVRTRFDLSDRANKKVPPHCSGRLDRSSVGCETIPRRETVKYSHSMLLSLLECNEINIFNIEKCLQNNFLRKLGLRSPRGKKLNNGGTKSWKIEKDVFWEK